MAGSRRLHFEFMNESSIVERWKNKLRLRRRWQTASGSDHAKAGRPERLPVLMRQPWGRIPHKTLKAPPKRRNPQDRRSSSFEERSEVRMSLMMLTVSLLGKMKFQSVHRRRLHRPRARVRQTIQSQWTRWSPHGREGLGVEMEKLRPWSC